MNVIIVGHGQMGQMIEATLLREGGHNILSNYSFLWFKNQKKGQPAVWNTEKDSGKALELTK